MRVYAVTMVKNEQDVIGPVIEHLLAEGVDHVIAADNLSTDRTREILDGLATRLPVTVVNDPEVAYFQAEKMNRLADLAREAGAEWVIPFDADELWVSPGGRLADVIRGSVDADVLVADWLDHVASPVPLRPGLDPFRRMTWRERHPNEQQKVAYRLLPGVRVRMGNHGVEQQEELREVRGRIEVHHYRYRSFGHYVAKNQNGKSVMDAAGDAMPDEWCAHWRKLGGQSRRHLAVRWARLWFGAARRGIVRDPVVPRH